MADAGVDGFAEELDAGGSHRADGADDVVGRESDVLDAGAAVELEVFVDLALLLAQRGLVERELHLDKLASFWSVF